MDNVEMKLESIRNYNFHIKTEDKATYLKVEDDSMNCSIDVYNKMNPEKPTEQPEDTKSVFRKVSKTDRELIHKAIVKVDKPYEGYTSEAFSYCICKKVCTVRVDKTSFSYLNNPCNDDCSFYINLNPLTEQYDLIDRIRYEIEVEKHLNISYDVITEFVKGVNLIIKSLPVELQTAYRPYRFKQLLKVLFLYLIMIIMSICAYTEFDNLHRLSKPLAYATIALLMIFIICVLYYTYFSVSDKFIKYTRYKVFLSHQKEVENYINQWCSVHFKKLSKQVIVPTTFQYIQFCYDPNLYFYIENHEVTNYI
jgi:hypothetical protein